jgi:MFS family permease
MRRICAKSRWIAAQSVFGWLSDKVGRNPIVVAGCALSALNDRKAVGAVVPGSSWRN